MGGARGYDEIVVRNAYIFQFDGFVFQVKTHRLSHENPYVFVTAHNAPHGRGDIAGRESGRRNLIQERLKGMVVLAVHQSHPHRQLAQRARRIQSSEPRAQNQNMRTSIFFAFRSRHGFIVWVRQGR